MQLFETQKESEEIIIRRMMRRLDRYFIDVEKRRKALAEKKKEQNAQAAVVARNVRSNTTKAEFQTSFEAIDTKTSSVKENLEGDSSDREASLPKIYVEKTAVNLEDRLKNLDKMDEPALSGTLASALGLESEELNKSLPAPPRMAQTMQIPWENNVSLVENQSENSAQSVANASPAVENATQMGSEASLRITSPALRNTLAAALNSNEVPSPLPLPGNLISQGQKSGALNALAMQVPGDKANANLNSIPELGSTSGKVQVQIHSQRMDKPPPTAPPVHSSETKHSSKGGTLEKKEPPKKDKAPEPKRGSPDVRASGKARNEASPSEADANPMAKGATSQYKSESLQFPKDHPDSSIDHLLLRETQKSSAPKKVPLVRPSLIVVLVCAVLATIFFYFYSDISAFVE